MQQGNRGSGQRDVGRRDRGRRRIAAVVALALAATGLAAGVPAAVQAATVPSYSESRDYAMDTFSNPWDYADTADQNTDNTSGGRWYITGKTLNGPVAPKSYFSPVAAVDGSLPYGRDGRLNTIVGSKYSHFSFSMDQPMSDVVGSIQWFTCPQFSPDCMGGLNFRVQPGSHVYDVDLTGPSILGAKVPWKTAKIVAFRVQPVVLRDAPATPATLRIDWARLHATAAGTGGAAPTAQQQAAAARPAGDYGSYVVTPRPLTVVDSPNPDEGQDLATAQRGRPWDFRNAANASGVALKDATLLRYDAKTGLNARNAGPIVNDPEVLFPVTSFSGSTYHWLSWSMLYDGAYSLEDKAGGGKVARLIWAVNGVVPLQVGNDTLTFSGVNSMQEVRPGEAALNRIDLLRRNPLDESMPAGSAGWANRTITSLRFDPNEDRGTGVWRLGSFALRADPTAKGKTTVKFHDEAWVAGSTATVTMIRDDSGTRRVIASDVAVAKGSNAATFTLGSAAAGLWRASVSIRHPDGSIATSVSSAPVKMTR